MSRIVLGAVIAITALVTLAARSGEAPKALDPDAAQTQSALLRIGMNLQVSDCIRKGDTEAALRLLNAMNVIEVTPLLTSRDDQQLLDMKRRVFRRLALERSKISPPTVRDEESEQLNKDIDAYLRKYR